MSVMSPQSANGSADALETPRQRSMSKRFLVWAFCIQLTVVLFCLVVGLRIYLDYKQKLGAQISENKELAIDLTSQQKQIDLDKREISQRMEQQVFLALQMKDYTYAAAIATSGLKDAPHEPIFEWYLVKSLILQGNIDGALKQANATASLEQPSQDKLRNLMTLGIAKCAAHDDLGSIQAIHESGQAASNRDEIEQFCSTSIRNKL